MPKIGVVIRTLNESELIGRCLDSLARQQPGFDLDVLVVDSGSTDATIEIARSGGARIHEIAPDDFDYSTALNVGIERVEGDLVLILSAHAIPTDEHWIARMIAPFADPEVAGVACRQVPWEGAPWREVARLEREFGPARRVYAGKGSRPLFSNAASCIRRTVWQQEPFTLPAAEDLEWARRVVGGGWSVVYEAGASVYHSHDETPREQARRLLDINRAADPGAPRRRALREAAAYLRRDATAIARLDAPVRRKVAYLGDVLAMVAYYVADFSRRGTTAERRREDVRAA
ncbi:MAG TPA: glycosyltransferase family A protein [Solirubrobacteraceae bacterium]|nr:glycosyltransferase family A protein [Solirubrobacteraceae bacterium]